MTPAHVPAVAELEKICFSSPWSAATLREGLANPHILFYVAEGESGVLGYAGMYHVLDEGYIANIAVFPAYRRQGVAQALLGALNGYAAGNGMAFLTLEVRASNEPAVALYRKNGFEQKGRRRGFYTLPSEDALIMTKTYPAARPDDPSAGSREK